MKLLTLDSAGYLSDPPLIIDRILNNFAVANYSQSIVHYGQIKSLAWLIQRYAQDKYGLQSSIKESLEIMLSGYFDTVDVNVSIEPTLEETEVKQNIIIDVMVSRGIQTWSMGKLLQTVNNKLFKIEDKD